MYDMQVPIFVSIFPLILLAILFYLGQKYHSNVNELSDAIYQSAWYRYPRTLQYFVLNIMIRSQQPFHLSAIGIIKLNLENFVGVSTFCEYFSGVILQESSLVDFC